MILDTYHDQQNGFVFGTNAVGTQYDAQVRNEGQSQAGAAAHRRCGRTSGGSGGGVNVNWDGAWDVKSLITETGWTAEFAIPLRTLRYGPPPQVWGLNFTRNIQRKRETVYWSPVSRIYNLTRLSSAGELRDLRVATPRNLKIMPYALGSANRNFAAATDTNYASGLRRGRQVRRDVEPEPRPHVQHRLRAGRSRRAADQPDAVQRAVPGKAAVLPREPRPLRRRQERRSGPVLQPGHRHRRQRRARADRGRRAAHRQGERHERRAAQHADRRHEPDAVANNFSAVRISKDLREPHDRRRHLRQPVGDRRSRPATTTGTGRGGWTGDWESARR